MKRTLAICICLALLGLGAGGRRQDNHKISVAVDKETAAALVKAQKSGSLEIPRDKAEALARDLGGFDPAVEISPHQVSVTVASPLPWWKRLIKAT